MSADAVIDAVGLTKSYDKLALNGLDLTVRRGDVHGFLGPNGGRQVHHLLSITLVTALFLFVGFAGFRRRDLAR
ncbi:hypothetical protein [Arthrobacter jinronghuae]|uniref:hypothetical protein n=1 Tax=Arthrobacter jinronghuae TaxID=2964609 RepID=UPI0027E2FA88|nr:hypothetical protein [Arthrobacter jinronghuae]